MHSFLILFFFLQLEIQYQKIHREYEELARRQEKREQLEREMQAKMQDEIARLRDRNSQLRGIENLFYRSRFWLLITNVYFKSKLKFLLCS